MPLTEERKMVTKSDFYGIDQYTLSTPHISVTVMTLGATVKSIIFKGRELTLNYGTKDEYMTTTCYPGALVGRYANRIKDGKININGKEYQLDKNNGANHLHGGFNGSDKKIWTVTETTENSVYMEYFSPDGESGYPASLTMGVRYTVENNRFRIDFYGESDGDTVYAPTTHTYFNLAGTPTVHGTKITINAEKYVPVDKELIPTGEILPTEGVFDFKTGRALEENYDHCFILAGKDAFSAEAGDVKMTFTTNFPALQLYTGEFLKDGFNKNSGFAAEPEYCPDSPNRACFESPLLKKGEKFEKFVEYLFF